ncbi:MAG: hypothetical protein ACLPS1_08210 [Streptosporangiaceae bacterium]
MLGDRGFRADLPPGLQVPLQQWHAKVTVTGSLDIYTLRLRLPDLDDAPDPEQPPVAYMTGERAVTSTRYRAPLSDSDRLVLAARFEAYLAWRHAGDPAPASARDTAERIGWPIRWPSGARTSGTATCGWAFPGSAGRGPWRSSRCCWSPPAS